MPIPPPDLVFDPNPTGFQLYAAGALIYSFPASFFPDMIGGETELTIDRPPGSSINFTLGDNLPTPRLLTLSGPRYYNSRNEAFLDLAMMRRAVGLADAVLLEGVPWAVLLPGTGNLTATPLGSDSAYQVVVKLAPQETVTPEQLAFGPLALVSVQSLNTYGQGLFGALSIPYDGTSSTPGAVGGVLGDAPPFSFTTARVGY